MDGNKRTAFAAVRAFLGLNGMSYPGEPMDLARQLEVIAAREGPQEEATRQFESWLRARIVSRPRSNP